MNVNYTVLAEHTVHISILLIIYLIFDFETAVIICLSLIYSTIQSSAK